MTIESKCNEYPFFTRMPVRITDINYAKHLGHMAIVGIFHNARLLFLEKNGYYDEMNIDGSGLILCHSSCSFKNEAHFNTNLIVSVGIGNYSKLKFEFLYKAVNENTGAEVVTCKEELVCFDYAKKKVTKIPKSFLEFCHNNQIKNIENCIQTS